jgi:hypothetical protein
MHKSRLAGFIIDCQTEDLDAAARSGERRWDWRRKRFHRPAKHRTSG